MARGFPSQDHGKRDDLTGIFLLAFSPIIVSMIIGAIWDHGHADIARFHGYIRYLELWPIYTIGKFLDLSNVPGFGEVIRIVDTVCAPDGLICTREFNEVAWQEISNASFIINAVILLFLIFNYIRWIWSTLHKHPEMRFTRTHNLKSFMIEMRQLYPHLEIFSRLDMISKPIHDATWGMSLTSREFAMVHALIRAWHRDDDGNHLPVLNRRKAESTFVQQLGRELVFRSTVRTKDDKELLISPVLSVSETMVMAAIMPLVAATDTEMPAEAFDDARSVSNEVLAWCWTHFKVNPKAPDDLSWMRPEIDLEFPRSVINKYIRHQEVQRMLRRHAYVRTAIHGLMLQARRLGVLSAADLRWLRFYDRPFWYAIQNIGRPSCFAEAAGIGSHFRNEVKAGKPLKHPCVDEAITALDTAITSYAYTDDEVERYIKKHLKP